MLGPGYIPFARNRKVHFAAMAEQVSIKFEPESKLNFLETKLSQNQS